MTHEELRDRLLDLAYGELSPRVAREVEAHAASCEACRAELAAIRGTRQVMSALPVEPAPERGERILVAAAREAARARTPRRVWPRWLWAAPVVAASLAAVVAITLRVEAPPPPSAAHEDVDALRGEASPYARAPAAPPAAPQAEAPQPEAPVTEPQGVARDGGPPAKAPGPRLEVPRLAMKKAEAPRGESRFATPPPRGDAAASAPGPREERTRSELALNLGDAAPATPPPASASASAAPPAPAPARPFAAAPPAGAAAPPAPSAPARREAGGGAAAAQDERTFDAEARRLSDGEARREAAPAPAPARRAKTTAAPQAVREASSPRDRALAAARARASLLGVETSGMNVEVGVAAVSWDEWRAQAAGPGAAPPAALNGRRFWPVVFRAAPGRPGGDLTVFVEDGTFRPLGELRGD